MGDHLGDRLLSYGEPGATRPAEGVWTTALPGFRRYEGSVPVGRGAHAFETASSAPGLGRQDPQRLPGRACGRL